MCYPLAIAAVAATVAGTVMSSMGQQQSRDAQSAVNANEVNQQKNLQQDEMSAFNRSLAASQPQTVQANAAADTASRMSQIQQQGGLDASSILPSQAAHMSSATKNAVVQDNSNIVGKLTQQAQGSAALGGVGDAFRTLGYQTLPNADRIAMDQNFSAGDYNLQPIELKVAASKGSGLRSVGSLFTTLGSLASMGAGAAGEFAGLGSALSGAGASLANGAVGAAGAGTAIGDAGVNVLDALGSGTGAVGNLSTFGFPSLSGFY